MRKADARDDVPVPPARRQLQRRSGREADEPAVGIEDVEHGREVALVGAAAVQEHERARRLAGGLADEVDELLAHAAGAVAPRLLWPVAAIATGNVSRAGKIRCPYNERGSMVVRMATTADPGKAALLTTRELRAWRGMLRAHAALAKALDAQLEAAHGLQLSSYEVLMYLADAEDERMRMCDLASSILLSRSGLTRLVDRLQREGLLERVACDADARGAFAKLTPTGRERLAAARATHLAGVREMFLDLFTPDEQEFLGEAWDRVLARSGFGCC
jgi:DNA-binding MarR family transcriptional regulator